MEETTNAGADTSAPEMKITKYTVEAAENPFRARCEFIAALAAMQGELEPAEKDAVAEVRGEKANYDYKYATLASCMRVCRRPLSSNGFGVLQPPEIRLPTKGAHGEIVAGSVTVRTRLLHRSGHEEGCDIELSLATLPPQAAGAIIAFARRYGLSAMVGLVADDDLDDMATPLLPPPPPPPAPKRAKAPTPTPPELASASTEPAPKEVVDIKSPDASVDFGAAIKAAATLPELQAIGAQLKAASKDMAPETTDWLRSLYETRKTVLKPTPVTQ